VRIIGGEWRGRRLPVLDHATLRPTKDLVRETLFNWIQPLLPGSRCLDAFAGSGALGFEAASRGASEVVLVEPVNEVYQSLRNQAAILQASQVQVVAGSAQQYLQQAAHPFDIVFLDPPFEENLLTPVCTLLAGSGWLRSGSRVYLEADCAIGLPVLPAGWDLQREKKSGDVIYGLAIIE
jgi:16S rRNA (guanine966-N2)-methyltransferase